MREMFSQQPAIANRWAKETPNIKSLPEKVGVSDRLSWRMKKKVKKKGYA